MMSLAISQSEQSIKVLLIEDMSEDRILIEELLESISQDKFYLQSVASLQEGMACLKTNNFDIVLLDLLLPDGIGINSLVKLKAESQPIPIVILTHLNDEKIALEALHSGAQDYLIKGRFQRHQLVRAIRYAIERFRIEEMLRQQAQRERLLGRILERIRRSLNFEEVLKSSVDEVRLFLQTDRTIIYRFNPDWSGAVIVESVAEKWPPIFNITINDPCFARGDFLSLYKTGLIRSVDDIFDGSVQSCYANMLSQFQVRANLIVPILQEDNLWGLLIAHHCQSTRQWQQWEIDFLSYFASQAAIAIQQSELYCKLQIANEQLEFLAKTDGLTGVANRRHFDEVLTAQWQQLAREKLPISLILCDLDYFKVYNDTLGHAAGDICLKQVSQVLVNSQATSGNLIARYGGEEFAIILPNTDLKDAINVAKVMGEAVESLQIIHPKSPISQYVTVSLGIASEIPQLEQSYDRLFQNADRALYLAKNSGRNRLCAES
jgi:two-component system, cell cycle response regulator